MFTRQGKSISKNAKGAAAVIFALVVGVLILLAASAIELLRISEVKSKLDVATDAAALAGKRAEVEATGTQEDRRAAAEIAAKASYELNKKQFGLTADNFGVTFSWDADDSLRVKSTANAKLVFGDVFSLGGMTGLDHIKVSSLAVAGSGDNQFVEIAMVLDNTGSMFSKDGRPETRFTLLRTAATNFVNGAFDKASPSSDIRVSVIPWATTVNIKSEAPAATNVATVSLSTPADYGSRTLPSSPIDRSSNINQSSSQLNTDFAPVGWRGCISGSGESLAASDDAKSSMKWDALLVPPNTHKKNYRPSKSVNQTCTYCPSTGGGGGGGGGGSPAPGLDGYWTPKEQQNRGYANFTAPMNRGVKNVAAGCYNYPCTVTVCDNSKPLSTGTNCSQDTVKYYGSVGPYQAGRRNSFMAQAQECFNNASQCQPTLPKGNHVACVADPNEIAWNNGGGARCSWVPASDWKQFDITVGPNMNCPMPMLGLSGNRGQVLETLNRMSPVGGGTHADVGLRWGLRSLSPRSEWTGFFKTDSANPPSAFGLAGGKKVMVLITDGQNERANDFPGYWGCGETGSPGCSGAPDTAELNTRMLNWCTSIRNTYKVEIYTVAVNVSNASAVNLLQQCSGDPTRSFAVDASELNDAFSAISKSIFALRIKE
jgi:Flp pilus assembly protein TadG